MPKLIDDIILNENAPDTKQLYVILNKKGTQNIDGNGGLGKLFQKKTRPTYIQNIFNIDDARQTAEIKDPEKLKQLVADLGSGNNPSVKPKIQKYALCTALLLQYYLARQNAYSNGLLETVARLAHLYGLQDSTPVAPNNTGSHKGCLSNPDVNTKLRNIVKRALKGDVQITPTSVASESASLEEKDEYAISHHQINPASLASSDGKECSLSQLTQAEKSTRILQASSSHLNTLDTHDDSHEDHPSSHAPVITETDESMPLTPLAENMPAAEPMPDSFASLPPSLFEVTHEPIDLHAIPNSNSIFPESSSFGSDISFTQPITPQEISESTLIAYIATDETPKNLNNLLNKMHEYNTQSKTAPSSGILREMKRALYADFTSRLPALNTEETIALNKKMSEAQHQLTADDTFDFVRTNLGFTGFFFSRGQTTTFQKMRSDVKRQMLNQEDFMYLASKNEIEQQEAKAKYTENTARLFKVPTTRSAAEFEKRLQAAKRTDEELWKPRTPHIS